MRVVVVSGTGDLGVKIRQGVLNAGLECGAGDCVRPADLPARLAKSPADVLLLSVSDTEPADAAGALQYLRGHSQAAVVAVGAEPTEAAAVAAIREGANGFVAFDRFQDELRAAVARLRPARTAKSGRGAWAVMGALPGVGATTIASNLAFALGGAYPGKVGLAELGRDTPRLASLLDARPACTVGTLAGAWQRLDRTLLAESATAHKLGVALVTQTPGQLDPDDFAPAAARQIAALLRAAYPWGVLDFGAGLRGEDVPSVAVADEAIVVLRLDVASVRAAKLLVARLREGGIPGDNVLLVANRGGEAGQLSVAQAERGLGRRLFGLIPNAPRVVNAAANKGLPACRAAGGPFRRRILALARKLVRARAG